MKKLFILFLLIASASLFAQTVGDYGSLGTGNWGTTGANWVVCVTAGTWDGATPAPAAPDTTKNVWIRAGHTVTIEVSPKTCFNLYVETNGSLITGQTSNRYIRFYGTELVNNGNIGGATDGLSFGYYSADFTLKGNGTYVMARNQPVSGRAISVTFDCDLTTTYVGSAIYCNGAATTFTINAGKTVTGSKGSYVSVGTSGSGVPGTGANLKWNIYGTLSLDSAGHFNLNNVSGRTCSLYVYNGGTVKFNNNCSFLDTNAVSTGHVINIEAGGKIDMSTCTGTCNVKNATTTMNGIWDFGGVSTGTRSIGAGTTTINGRIRQREGNGPTIGTLSFGAGSVVEFYGTTTYNVQTTFPVSALKALAITGTDVGLVSGVNPVVADSVTVYNGAKFNLSGNNISGTGNFTLHNGGSLRCANGNGLRGPGGTTGSIRLSGTLFFSSGASYIFQKTTGTTGFDAFGFANITTSPTPGTCNNLTIDNTVPGFPLCITDASMNVTGTLALTNGILQTGSHVITVKSGGTVTRTNGYVFGNLEKEGITGAQTFEVGTPNGYTPVNLTATGTGDFTVGTVGVTHPNALGSNILPMYWTLTNGGGITSADLVFNYLNGDVVGDENLYVLGKYDGSWSFPTATVNTTANTASITGVTSFSDWTLGENGALPVQLVTFKAYNEKGYVVLRWNTSTETQNYGWDIERRKTEKDKVTGWEKIGFVSGSMNSNSAKEYSYIDKNALYGQYEYRLRQNDLDGSVTYSDNVKITVGTKPVEYAVKNYPNPFNPSTIIRYEIPKSGYVNISVYNALGQKVRTIVEGYVEEGIYQQTFEASGMSTGIYFYTLKTDGVTITKKMMFIK